MGDLVPDLKSSSAHLSSPLVPVRRPDPLNHSRREIPLPSIAPAARECLEPFLSVFDVVIVESAIQFAKRQIKESSMRAIVRRADSGVAEKFNHRINWLISRYAFRLCLETYARGAEETHSTSDLLKQQDLLEDIDRLLIRLDQVVALDQ